VSSTLIGTRGQVVLNAEGEALTFLPRSVGNTGAASGAVVIYADRSAAGLSALTGGVTNYNIYKNGLPATAGDLRKNDVAIWNSVNSSIRVCDTRVTVYYESCSPSPSAPTTIEVLGGTQFHVLPTAVDSLAEFKPGDTMTLLLTADGQVAAAVDPGENAARGNAVGVVSESGEIQMFCGTAQIPLEAAADAKYHGKVVRISSTKKGVSLSVLQNDVSGDLNVTERMLGNKTLTENVMVFKKNELVGLSQLTQGVVPENQILYTRTNWDGRIDLIVLDQAEMIYGRALVDYEKIPVYDDAGQLVGEKTEEWTRVETDKGQTEPTKVRHGVRTGDYVAAKLSSSGTGFASIVRLTELKDVSERAWIGKEAVTFSGRTYVVPEDVLCYNEDNSMWITLDEALAYTDTANLYVHNGMVCIIEVGG